MTAARACLAHAQARVGHSDGASAVNSGRPDDAEAARLAATLGVALREARGSARMSAMALARGMGAHPSTITRLERGLRRPRAALLADAAAVLQPRSPGPLTKRLAVAAGPSLTPDTPASLRQRARCRRKARHEHQALVARAARAQHDTFALIRELGETAFDFDTADGLAQCEAYLDRRAELELAERFYRHAAKRWPRPPSRWSVHWR